MVEQATMMTREEFEQHHAATGTYIARVEKIWEQVAEEQQAIVDGKGYQHVGYGSWEEYWNKEWAKASGWSYNTVRGWLHSRRVKISTPLRGTAQYDDITVDGWREMSSLSPQERVEFINRYDEFKPETGVLRPVREAIKAFKGEPTVRELLTPEQYGRLPDPELTASEKWVFQTGKISMALRRLNPSEVAEDAYETMPNKLKWEVEDAQRIIDWYEEYIQAIKLLQSEGLRRVK